MSGLLKFVFGGLILWGAVTWFGASPAALGIAILVAWLAALSLDKHATELQRLRERLTALEENLNKTHAQFSDDIDRMKEQNRRLSERLDYMEPAPLHNDY